MSKGVSNKDVIAALRHKCIELVKDSERYEKLIAENKDTIDSLNKSIIALGGTIRTSSNGNKKAIFGITFKDRVLKILEDGRPRTSRQLYNEYLKVVGETNIKKFYDFSGRFSNILKSTGIKKHIILENPISKRYFYGKADWFEGNKLKRSYIDKIIYD